MSICLCNYLYHKVYQYMYLRIKYASFFYLEYVEAMHRSGNTGKLEYADIFGSKKKKKRNIIWFSPPFSEHVKTNIDKEFLRLLAKHFPPHHQPHKICNKFNIKVSYSCMLNMAAIISRRNKIVVSNRTSVFLRFGLRNL